MQALRAWAAGGERGCPETCSSAHPSHQPPTLWTLFSFLIIIKKISFIKKVKTLSSVVSIGARAGGGYCGNVGLPGPPKAFIWARFVLFLSLETPNEL